MKNRGWLVYYRLGFGLLGLSSIILEIFVLLERGTFNPGNFFSYFTVESNLLAVVALLLGAYVVAQKRRVKWLDMFRGAATLYMVMTGVVFAILLSGLKDVSFTAVPWNNTVLHYIMPIAMLVDWLLDTPKAGITWRRALVWLIFPLAYVIYTLVRGPFAEWYPYPFLSPVTNGYVGIVITSIGIMLFALVAVKFLTRGVKRTK